MTETVNAAEDAKNVVETQTEMVGQTREVFDKINQYTGQLIMNLENIRTSVRQADEERTASVGVIDNISASSLQTAASSSIVNKSAEGQLEIAESLKAAAGELQCNINELTDALAAFKIG